MNRSALFCAFLVLAGCASPMMRDQDVRSLNRELEGAVYTASQDLVADFSEDSSRDVIFKKGEKIRLYVEGGSDWIRVKGYKASEKREQAVGRTLVYLLREDLKDEDGQKVLRERIGRIGAAK